MKLGQLINSIIINEEDHRALTAKISTVLASKNKAITPTMFRVLYAATLAKSSTANGIQSRTGILGPSISRMYQTLVDQGLLSINTRPDDRRAKVISATAAGKRLVASVTKAMEK